MGSFYAVLRGDDGVLYLVMQESGMETGFCKGLVGFPLSQEDIELLKGAL